MTAGRGGGAGSSGGGAGGSSGGGGSAGSCAGESCPDECPDDDEKRAPGVCGCGMSEADRDDDETPDCVDDCADDPDKKTPGVCGCGAPDSDRDEDGSLDCADGCPDDPMKTAMGGCGCGEVDDPTDTDGDEVLDCVDGCPMDMAKSAPGMCGCGMPETGDTDGDDTLDCMDMCAMDPGKTAPGACGCGIPDNDNGAVIGCAALKDSLVRRYRFEGTGTSVVDSTGKAAGTVFGGAMLSSGSVTLDGNGDYVGLPDDIVSTLTNATIEMWVTWTGVGGDWQRLFDFGTGTGGSGSSYLFLTPRGTSPSVMRITYRATGTTSETRVDSDAALPANTSAPVHVAVVFDDANNQLRLYFNSTLKGTATNFSGRLADVGYTDNWLGRSRFTADPTFNGTIHEFRIYSRALTLEQLNFSLNQGMEPSYFPQ